MFWLSARIEAHLLNRPPEIRKKIQTFTIRLKPKATAIYNSTMGLKPVAAPVVEFCELSWAPIFATWVPAKAKKRNIVVPTNSPMVATKSARKVSN